MNNKLKNFNYIIHFVIHLYFIIISLPCKVLILLVVIFLLKKKNQYTIQILHYYNTRNY